MWRASGARACPDRVLLIQTELLRSERERERGREAEAARISGEIVGGGGGDVAAAVVWEGEVAGGSGGCGLGGFLSTKSGAHAFVLSVELLCVLSASAKFVVVDLRLDLKI
uniref:Uncharacterized protein n=1 Tax=Oryza rufipogon TaxID=4529 RepID=A0A0E0QIW8_ORYRU